MRNNPVKYTDPTGHTPYLDAGGGGGDTNTISPIGILRQCRGSLTCEWTEGGQWLLAHPSYDPSADPWFGQHEGYQNILHMLAQIYLDSGQTETALYYWSMAQGNVVDQAIVDSAQSIPQFAVHVSSLGGLWGAAKVNRPARYGPFYRLESSTQTPETARLQQEAGEIWGTAPRSSDIPAVQAYDGPLPAGVRGVEFYTDVSPDPGMPPRMVYWRGPRAGVRVEDGYAKICCVVTQNTQR